MSNLNNIQEYEPLNKDSFDRFTSTYLDNQAKAMEKALLYVRRAEIMINHHNETVNIITFLFKNL